jgi:hypothetical protein
MRRHHPRGTMMVVAIVLLGLIGVTLAGLTQQFALDFHRLQMQTDAAQARQILLASTRALARHPDQSFSLPAALGDSRADVKVTKISVGPATRVFRIDVVSGKSHLSEELTLRSASGRWSIADANLR